MPRYRHISVAVPMMAELDNVERLLSTLRRQHISFSLYVCVNQPEGWHNDPLHQEIFHNNQQTLSLLHKVSDLDLVVIDRSSVEQGWSGKQKGVGWARKLLFASIMERCQEDELVVSLDADTDFSDNYLATVVEVMNTHPESSAMGVPYYHPLSGDEALDRPLLRYECYMRYYLLQLLRIGSPYAFSALGSAMVFPLWAYRRAGGISPLQGGEDFYLMQRFCKTGTVLRGKHPDLVVRPQGRCSQRVPFGTGPAVAQGIAQQEQRYPFYPQCGFDDVRHTADLFPDLYYHDVETPMSSFLRSQLATNDLWGSLRKNFKQQAHFVHACHERVDGLRILQYLKQCPTRGNAAELQSLCQQLSIPISEGLSFATSPISELNALRNALFHHEMQLR